MFAVSRLAVWASLPAFLLATSLAPVSSSPDDRAASVGSWDVVAVVMNGRPVVPEITSMLQIAYREDGSWTVFFKGMAVGEGTSENDPDSSPKTFEMQTLGGTKTPPRKYSGIYKLEGDTRQLCFVIAGVPRPDEFRAPRGSGRILVTLKRAGERGIER
jgi:uncharacterized protein (TIGR03067 family)